MPLHAVLTADIVNSTKLEKRAEKKLFSALAKILRPYPNEFYRGDSFQAYIEDPKKSLHITLLCRTIAISLMPERTLPVDVRASVGIGKVETPVRKLGLAKGQAFILSGRSFDKMHNSASRLSLITSNAVVNAGLEVLSDYINSIYSGMTAKQAEVVFELLSGHNQQKTATRLKKSNSTIHQFVIAGRWPEIKKILRQFENLINPLL